MKKRILVVEDQFIEANNLQIMLENAGHEVCPIARSGAEALKTSEELSPDLVLLDIFLKGKLTGIDIAKVLREKNIAFIYLSANSDRKTFEAAKDTQPYGFLVKPYREKDVLNTIEIALHLQANIVKHNYYKIKSAESGTSEDLPASVLKRIIGWDTSLKDIISQLQMVAPTGTSVLILGESGTGKEQIADCLHILSKRKDKPFVKINCAALPAALIESELFGHERGAFTGAFDRKIGKFEQADLGTIFLDEIGELPTELQVKLLRVLQEKEVDRIGSNRVIKTDVRIIAASNRDLEKEVAEGRFRIDLYYRLNVFPITLPPLRYRKEDIPTLVDHFAKLYAREFSKIITGFSDGIIHAMMAYDWPGNIRELRHFVERAVLLTKSADIDDMQFIKMLQQRTAAIAGTDSNRIKSMDDNERDNIVAVLRKTNGKIFGKGGAAEFLGVSASTLNSRIRKLGISKERIFYK
jgi:two-component system response regulator HydG